MPGRTWIVPAVVALTAAPAVGGDGAPGRMADLWSGLGLAQLLPRFDARDPAATRSVAAGYGPAALEADAEGAPMISARIAGAPYWIFFHGCDDRGRACESLAFWTFLEQEGPVSAGLVNDWNRTRRFGKAYVDEDGDIVVEYDLSLVGGLSRASLDDTFDWWRLVLADATETFAR